MSDIKTNWNQRFIRWRPNGRCFKPNPSDGILSGVVAVKGSPTQNVVVELFMEGNNAFIASTTTGTFGDFEFTNLDKNYSYFLVMKEPTGAWEYRCSSRRIPV